jgi:hypothetical protein
MLPKHRSDTMKLLLSIHEMHVTTINNAYNPLSVKKMCHKKQLKPYDKDRSKQPRGQNDKNFKVNYATGSHQNHKMRTYFRQDETSYPYPKLNSQQLTQALASLGTFNQKKTKSPPINTDCYTQSLKVFFSYNTERKLLLLVP